MEKRLIDADAFLDELKEHHDSIMADQNIGKQMKWREAVCFGRTVDVLAKQPTVEVFGARIVYIGRTEKIMKPIATIFGNMMADSLADDFCSYGERRG